MVVVALAMAASLLGRSRASATANQHPNCRTISARKARGRAFALVLQQPVSDGVEMSAFLH
jgi:hypothetical protein